VRFHSIHQEIGEEKRSEVVDDRHPIVSVRCFSFQGKNSWTAQRRRMSLAKFVNRQQVKGDERSNENHANPRCRDRTLFHWKRKIVKLRKPFSERRCA